MALSRYNPRTRPSGSSTNTVSGRQMPGNNNPAPSPAPPPDLRPGDITTRGTLSTDPRTAGMYIPPSDFQHGSYSPVFDRQDANGNWVRNPRFEGQEIYSPWRGSLPDSYDPNARVVHDPLLYEQGPNYWNQDASGNWVKRPDGKYGMPEDKYGKPIYTPDPGKYPEYYTNNGPSEAEMQRRYAELDQSGRDTHAKIQQGGNWAAWASRMAAGGYDPNNFANNRDMQEAIMRDPNMSGALQEYQRMAKIAKSGLPDNWHADPKGNWPAPHAPSPGESPGGGRTAPWPTGQTAGVARGPAAPQALTPMQNPMMQGYQSAYPQGGYMGGGAGVPTGSGWGSAGGRSSGMGVPTGSGWGQAGGGNPFASMGGGEMGYMYGNSPMGGGQLPPQFMQMLMSQMGGGMLGGGNMGMMGGGYNPYAGLGMY